VGPLLPWVAQTHKGAERRSVLDLQARVELSGRIFHDDGLTSSFDVQAGIEDTINDFEAGTDKVVLPSYASASTSFFTDMFGKTFVSIPPRAAALKPSSGR
jgi:hypothetical protein